ncbi:MAG: hypothetical protein MK365_08635 [Vicinamibacterales bacterium]|nr:hypothetical protein [Vicinamibacterales bacterium]RUA01236.1 MAG: hypothetical protein DSY84_05595 [Candidatus Neomarinimicrobiota bacterium]
MADLEVAQLGVDWEDSGRTEGPRGRAPTDVYRDDEAVGGRRLRRRVVCAAEQSGQEADGDGDRRRHGSVVIFRS